MIKIDVNSDMGEGFGAWRVCDDEALMQVVSSANIACGFHAGDPAIMSQMVRLAKVRGVGIGAHPGLPDKQGFGRREMAFSAEDICQQVVYQIGALQAIARNEGVRVSHVSFHAAMGNMINRDESLARLVMRAIYRLDPTLVIFFPGRYDYRAGGNKRRIAHSDAVSRRSRLRCRRVSGAQGETRCGYHRRRGRARAGTPVFAGGNGDHHRRASSSGSRPFDSYSQRHAGRSDAGEDCTQRD